MMPSIRSAGVATLALLLSVPVAQAGERNPPPPDACDDQRPVPRVPDQPVPISNREVRAELREARQMRHREHLEDFLPLIRNFPLARTVRGLQLLAAEAMLFEARRRPVIAELLGALTFFAHERQRPNVVPGIDLGFVSNAPCPVNFDQPGLLAAVPDAAELTFIFDPWWRQTCGLNAEVRVEPLVYNHFHLVYEDSTIDCITEDGHFGRGEPGDCDPLPDPALEPREIGTHTGAEVLRITRRTAGTGELRTFSLASFANTSSEPVKVRYRRAAPPNWFQWNSLAGNTIWDVSDFVTNVVEVQITNAGTSLDCGGDFEAGADGGCPIGPAPIFVDDFMIFP